MYLQFIHKIIQQHAVWLCGTDRDVMPGTGEDELGSAVVSRKVDPSLKLRVKSTLTIISDLAKLCYLMSFLG